MDWLCQLQHSWSFIKPHTSLIYFMCCCNLILICFSNLQLTAKLGIKTCWKPSIKVWWNSSALQQLLHLTVLLEAGRGFGIGIETLCGVLSYHMELPGLQLFCAPHSSFPQAHRSLPHRRSSSSRPQSQCGLALAILGTWRVNHQMRDLCLLLLLFHFSFSLSFK